MTGPWKGRAGAFTVVLLFVLCAHVMLNNFEIGSYFQRTSQSRGEMRRERICEYHAAVEERLHEADGMAVLVTNVNTLLGARTYGTRLHREPFFIATFLPRRRTRCAPGQDHGDESAQHLKQRRRSPWAARRPSRRFVSCMPTCARTPSHSNPYIQSFVAHAQVLGSVRSDSIVHRPLHASCR
jgi:hypothetical protein